MSTKTKKGRTVRTTMAADKLLARHGLNREMFSDRFLADVQTGKLSSSDLQRVRRLITSVRATAEKVAASLRTL